MVSPVGRPRALGIVAGGVGQAAQQLALGIGLVDLVGGVEAPGVAAALSGRALLELLALRGLGARVRVRRREQDALAPRVDPGAGGLAGAR